MGNLCHKNTAPDVIKKIPPKDIQIEGFKEFHEDLFDIIFQFNAYRFFRIEEIVFLLKQNFASVKEDINDVQFAIFYEKKILRNSIISEKTLNDQILYSKFKVFSEKSFSVLNKAFKSYYKNLKGEKYDSKSTVPFVCLLPWALLYGEGRNDVKIDFIYNYFSNDKGELSLTDDFRFFLFALFAIPSAVALFTFQLITEENEDFKKLIEKYDFETIFSGYEVKDAVHCTDLMLKALFGDSTSINYIDFKTKFLERKFQLLICPKGIRSYINENNI